MDAHAADTGRNALLVGIAVIVRARKALIDNFPIIRLRIDLIYSRQAAFAAIGPDAAAEIKLTLIAHGIAEQRTDAVERFREQQLGLTGLGIDLDQDAAAVLVGRAVLLLLSIKKVPLNMASSVRRMVSASKESPSVPFMSVSVLPIAA